MRTGFFVLLCVALFALLPLVADPRPEREITLVARDMSFYLPADERPNPTLRLKAGERVRLTLRNEDKGITHDVAMQDLGVAMEPLRGEGVRTVTFRVPDRPGEHDYICRPHSRMMRGLVSIEE